MTFQNQSVAVPVRVAGSAEPVAPSFRQDILPILTRTGCNAGGCHGKLAGQNGFRLSLRGYAPDWDYDWLTKEVNGRRINLAFPEQSLLVRKPTGDVAHEGGSKFRQDSRYYRKLVDWIAARAPGPIADEPDSARLEILPGDREMQPGETQQLLVRAHYADGRVRDVTWLAQFFSNDEATLAVKPDGLVKALRCGEGSVRVHFQGQVAVISFTMPFDRPVAPEEFAARQNALDDPIFAKLQKLRLPPSGPCSDATFLRRAFLDTTGTLPTPEEVTAFLADPQPDKRVRLVDALLERPEWVDFWTLQFADLLQNRVERDHDVRGAKGVRAFHQWLRSEMAANRPWDQLAREIILARGDVISQPQVGYFVTLIGEKRNVEESELPDAVAQAFLGTRIGCARCHNHPLEKYTQDDFYHFAAFFAKVALDRAKPETGATKLDVGSAEELQQRGELEKQAVRLKKLTSAGGEEKEIEQARKRVEETQRRVDELAARPPGVNQPRTGQRLEPPDARPRGLDVRARAATPGSSSSSGCLKSENFSGAMVNRLVEAFLQRRSG